MTTPPIPLTKPYRRQIKIPQFAAPLNVVISQEGISISVASYGQYCKITWWQMIQVMAPPLYSGHKKAVPHLREQVAMYKAKLEISKEKKIKKKKDTKVDKIDHAAIWKKFAEQRLKDGRPVGQLFARKELLQSLQSPDTEKKT